MNHTRHPKDVLPDWARRDNQVIKDDRVEERPKFFGNDELWHWTFVCTKT